MHPPYVMVHSLLSTLQQFFRHLILQVLYTHFHYYIQSYAEKNAEIKRQTFRDVNVPNFSLDEEQAEKTSKCSH